MKKQIEQVKEFNKVFGVKDVSLDLRYDMIYEELSEYYLAGDKIEEADAIGDMLYLLFGAVIDAGLEDKIEPILDEIHRSNMSKIEWMPDGDVLKAVVLRRADGKIQKGKNYFKPNIEQILNK